MRNEITNFLAIHGIIASRNEDIAITELMMDNHKCVEWDNIQYYIPEDRVYDGDEELIYEFLTTCYHV